MSFQIKNETPGVIEISNGKTRAKIFLNEGASLQELVFDGEKVIGDVSPLDYKDTYASSLLFPFASRVEDGKYRFNNQDFQLEINELDRNHALHGLVYNKPFVVRNQDTAEDYAKIDLEFEETNLTKGFPYTYSVFISYFITDSKLDFSVQFKNTSNKAFPFTYGWHPYFYSSDVSKSFLQFQSSKEVVFDERLITQNLIEKSIKGKLTIGQKQLDDCFQLDTTKVIFSSPNYDLEIKSSTKNGFLQVYTPPIKNCIAIEPVSGISNSFNNNIGLEILEPKEIKNVSWSLDFTSRQ
jgi:aldose 1-epimerase